MLVEVGLQMQHVAQADQPRVVRARRKRGVRDEGGREEISTEERLFGFPLLLSPLLHGGERPAIFLECPPRGGLKQEKEDYGTNEKGGRAESGSEELTKHRRRRSPDIRGNRRQDRAPAGIRHR